MHIRKPTYKKEDVDCKLCTEYRGKKHPCPHDVCPFIAERIEAGAVTYWDAVNAMVSPQYRFSRRLPKLAEEYPGTFFLDDRHRSRMEFLNTQLGYVPGRNTPAYYAAMYLLEVHNMAFFNSAIEVLQTLVVALGAGLGVWGAINLMEGYGNDNPGAKSQGMKQFMAN